MSGNPFRRSSLKGPVVGTVRPEIDSSPAPLSIDTGVRTTSQTKRVAFRSPPALPISPDSDVSSPPSPISARIFASSEGSGPISKQRTAFGEGYPDNPFHTDSSGDEDAAALEHARQNAEDSSAMTALGYVPAVAPQDAVQDTLSRFASRPKGTSEAKLAASSTSNETSAQPTKPAMDVNAFARMLLTGDSASTANKGSPSSQPPSAQGPYTSETSSSADTASISRQSIFEPIMPPFPAETPRTSQEMDTEEAETERRQMASSGSLESKRKPTPPKPRHGKSAKSLTTSDRTFSQLSMSQITTPAPNSPNTINTDRLDLNKPLPLPPVHEFPTEAVAPPERMEILAPDAPRRPPTPPLSRRRSSQKQSSRPDLSRSGSLRANPAGRIRNSASSSSSLVTNPAPPPPPTRRMTYNADRRPSADQSSEEPDRLHISTDTPAKPPPPPSRTPSSNKRMSQPALVPPPLPPPRRARGSSKTSFDMQRPVIMVPALDSVDQSGASPRRPSADSPKAVSGGSNANDILADLARLQRDVDAMRKRGENE